MVTPIRRSSRLRSATPQNQNSPVQPAFNLSSLVEREETPNNGIQSTLDSIASSPACKALQKNASKMSFIPSPLKTPLSAARLRPAPEEMHPSRYHSTAKRASTKKEDPDDNGEDSNQETPTKLAAAASNTPSKTQSIEKLGRMAFTSPTFEFKAMRPSSELSTEAQKMMDEVREQAARIKVELLSQRDEQNRKDGETEKLLGVGGRRIARPKGKVGRFSDIHMEHFKKMDSIANHPSSFRSDISHSVPRKSLKRSNSNAELDAIDGGLKRLDSQKSPSKESAGSPQTPAKKFKQQHVFTSKPKNSPFESSPASEFENQISLATSKLPIPSMIITPTKPAYVRSTSVKSMSKVSSKDLAFGRSPSSKVLSTPTTVSALLIQTEGNKKYRNAIANKITTVRSILKRPQLRFSDDPVKLAAGTHVSTPKHLAGLKSPEILSHGLPSVPEDSPSLRKEKKVNFTASTNTNGPGEDAAVLSDSLTKQAGLSPFQVTYPTLSDVTSPYSNYNHQVMPQDQPEATSSSRRPGDFTFRAGQMIRFSTPIPNSPTPAATTPTIRKVRPSSASTAPSRAPVPSQALGQLLPSIPHGLANRKRKHDGSDAGPEKKQVQAFDIGSDVDKENRCDSGDREGSPAKKARLMPGSPVKATSLTSKSAATGKARAKIRANAASAAAARPKPAVEQRRGKGFLSLSRLNALAMPKTRK